MAKRIDIEHTSSEVFRGIYVKSLNELMLALEMGCTMIHGACAGEESEPSGLEAACALDTALRGREGVDIMS